jgi:hypothetical protein
MTIGARLLHIAECLSVHKAMCAESNEFSIKRKAPMFHGS